MAVAALASEIVFYRWWSRDVRIGRIILMVIAINVASSAVGMVIAAYLPTGYNPAFPKKVSGPLHGPEWNQLAAISWVVAFLVSIAIEWPLLVAFRRFVDVPRKLIAAVFANALSYLVLLIVFFV